MKGFEPSTNPHDSAGNSGIPVTRATTGATISPGSEAPTGLGSAPIDPARQALLNALQALPAAALPDALTILKALPSLPPAIRAGILAMVKAMTEKETLI